MSSPVIGARTVTPSQMEPGDVVSDIDGSYRIMVDEIKSIRIQYGRSRVPVWWIKGVSMSWGESANLPSTHKIQTVCLPGQAWYLLRRREA